MNLKQYIEKRGEESLAKELLMKHQSVRKAVDMYREHEGDRWFFSTNIILQGIIIAKQIEWKIYMGL